MIRELKDYVYGYVVVVSNYLYYFGIVNGIKKLVEDRKYWM